jgi:signal transduction histidine kinase
MSASPDDPQELRRCVRDLVALSTLPAVWSNADPRTIAGTLSEVLVRLLSLDLNYLRVGEHGPALEVAHGRPGAETAGGAQRVGRELAPWLTFHNFYAPPTVPNPLGGAAVRLAVLPLGHGRERGLLAAGSGRPDFPTETERLLLRVGANQAAVALQRAEAVEALREADRRKDEFLAMLAHELRNPLAPIRNGLQIMRLAGDPGGEVQAAREMIGRQVEHMVRLIDDLLDLSRISRGKIELRRERVELATVLQNALETSRPLIEAAGHELTVALPPGRVWLEADATRLAQVVANLLNNAAKYTKPGGRIWLTAEQAGGQAVIRVRDTGIGLPPEMLPHVFEMFAQGETSLARSQGGLGIGLTLVKSLVEMHQGTVEAHSAGPGRGSEFVVRLPALEDDGAMGRRFDGVREGHPVTPSKRHPVRILVVDDNVDAARSLGLLLTMQGHETALAHDGAGALEAARTFRPQLVLLDIEMPGMSGYEVARRFRQQPDWRDVVLVALTGWGQPDDLRRCREAGFDQHLTKPAESGAIEKLLAELGPPAP